MWYTEKIYLSMEGGVMMDFWEEHPSLYACGFCGELFEATMIPQGCSQCGRLFADSVYDLDTGETAGGEILIRPATEYESSAYYKLRDQGEKRRIRVDTAREPDGGKTT